MYVINEIIYEINEIIYEINEIIYEINEVIYEINQVMFEIHYKKDLAVNVCFIHARTIFLSIIIVQK